MKYHIVTFISFCMLISLNLFGSGGAVGGGNSPLKQLLLSSEEMTEVFQILDTQNVAYIQTSESTYEISNQGSSLTAVEIETLDVFTLSVSDE